MNSWISRACAALIVAATLPAWAAEPAAPAQPASSDEWSAASESRLADLRGGLDGGSTSSALLAATVSENQVGDGVTTGTVVLGAGAVSDIRGISVQNFNTGNNVAIQTNLHVEIRLQ